MEGHGPFTSFQDITIEEALRKLTSNRGTVFKRRGKNSYNISRVVIAASSHDVGNINIKSHYPLKKPAPSSGRPASSTLMQTTRPRAGPTMSLSITNEKTGAKSKIVPNELVLRFKKGLSKEEIQFLIAETGATIKTNIKALNYYVLSLPPNLSVNDALIFYRKKEVVDQVEPNYLISIKGMNNDLGFSKQWSLNNTGQTGGADDADIDAPRRGTVSI